MYHPHDSIHDNNITCGRCEQQSASDSQLPAAKSLNEGGNGISSAANPSGLAVVFSDERGSAAKFLPFPLSHSHSTDGQHTFSTRPVQARINLYAVKELMGHESIKTTERYIQHYPESLRPSAMVLDTVPNSEQMQFAIEEAMKKAFGEDS